MHDAGDGHHEDIFIVAVRLWQQVVHNPCGCGRAALIWGKLRRTTVVPRPSSQERRGCCHLQAQAAYLPVFQQASSAAGTMAAYLF